MVHVPIVESCWIWQLRRVIVSWAVGWAWGYCGLLRNELKEDPWAHFEAGVVFEQLDEHGLFFVRKQCYAIESA